jgi:hypothetical protein
MVRLFATAVTAVTVGRTNSGVASLRNVRMALIEQGAYQREKEGKPRSLTLWQGVCVLEQDGGVGK